MDEGGLDRPPNVIYDGDVDANGVPSFGVGRDGRGLLDLTCNEYTRCPE
jgi:hypothetical protein